MAQIVIFNNKGGVAHEKLHIIQQPINEITDALNQAGISNYYKNVFKTLTKQFLILCQRQRSQFSAQKCGAKQYQVSQGQIWGL